MLLWPMRLLVFLVAAGGALAAHALQVRDDRGAQVTLDHVPRRIVSLLPSLTETVCALGACGRLVGVDRYSNHPASVRSLPSLGGGIDPQIEAVVALKPDLVLVATSSRAVARLESLGLKVLALEPRRSADVQRVIGLLGQVLGVPDAQRVWQAINAEVAAVAQSLPPQARGLRVYFEVNRGPYAAGRSSFIGEVLSRMGLDNVITPELGPYPKINPEYVVRANPELILISQRNAQDLGQRPGWAGIHAMRDRRVCLFDAGQADVLVRAGPRMAEAARLVVACVSDKVK